MMNQWIEERQEICSVASKLVSIKLYRKKCEDQGGEGEITGFDCSAQSTNCQTRCTYKLLLEDF